ncbi:MAG TPA: hypothetical protein VEK07_25620 [Polyangiaceae bacterium]|nr:hypothetical protein [Polyangiaceae bacterium]
MSESRIRWPGGGEARIVALEADRLVLHSTAACPPGSRIEGALDAAVSVPLRIKILACRRQPDGEFVLHGRLLDVTRADRMELERIVRGGPCEAPRK